MITYEIIDNVLGQQIKGTLEDGSVMWIPEDLANADYQTYLASLEA